MITLKIDDKKLLVKKGTTVFEAALQNNLYIPNLCYHPDLSPIGACRLCVVEIEGMKGFPTACTTEARERMVVHTNTTKLQEFRKNIIWFILSEYPDQLNETTQLKKVVDFIGAKELLPGYMPPKRNLPIREDDPLFLRDPNKCILCDRCVRICQDVRGVGAIGYVNRGINTIVTTPFEISMADADCKFCGACVEVCPAEALTDREKFEPEEREAKLVPCKNSCPAKIDIPRYVKLIAEGKFQDSIEVIREKVPFPNVLGYVCTHPCEEACRREKINEPIGIRELKKYAASRDSYRWKEKLAITPDTGKKVAIIGSGPGGLTAAWFLRTLGYSVTIFESLSEAGGMMRMAIPKYRLPREILDKEIEEVENIGVQIKLNTKIESLDELFNQDFNAIFVAIGATKGMKMKIPGEDSPKVLDGLSALKAINFEEKIDIKGTVIVVGGGNVAIDVARSVLRKGAEKVVILYRRTQKEMPAAEEEIEEALKEGIEIKFLVTPKSVTDKNDNLEIECIKMELGEPDASGRRRPIEIKDSEFTLKADKLIMAIGQRSAVPEGFELQLNKKGTIQADEETLTCSQKGVFAGGDVVSGPASIIEAIQHGRIAASEIDKFLGGSGQIEQKFVLEDEENPYIGREEKFAYKKRINIPTLPVDKRQNNFALVELGIDEKLAMDEAKRCLKCQLRLKISQAPLPPERQTE